MGSKISDEQAQTRRAHILTAARWCFLNFGFAKTSLDDIAKRAAISRTLLYRTFKGKEDIFTEVFSHWLVARHPDARRAVEESGSLNERLFKVCRVIAIDPWAEMVGAPMAGDFFEVCERIDPKVSEQHRAFAVECFTKILKNHDEAEVFLLALDGLYEDEPSVERLESRVRILVSKFTGEL